MQVLKFGGTSVGSPQRMQEVAQLISDGQSKIIVLSAVSGTTNKLVALSGHLLRKEKQAAVEKLTALEVEYENFVSTTSERSKAWEFYFKNLDKTGEAAWVEIISKSGKKIDRYSSATEWEVLHKSKLEVVLKDVEVDEKYLYNAQDVLDYGDPPNYIHLTKIILEEK